MKLPVRIVEKPWGRTDIPAAFGDMGGRRIGEIWFEDPDGDAAPLMVKFLFTSERLSIQVHPDDAAAQAAGYPRGKEECWLVLDATPEAELGVGLTAPTDTPALRAAALDGSIEGMIDWRRAQAGDFVYNAAGTIHAIGAGVTVVEVQQNVDCTYRLYDYGRPRELHLDAGLAVSRTTPHHEPRDRHVPPEGTLTLVSGPHFHLVRVRDSWPALDTGGQPVTVVPLSSGCAISGEPLAFGECARVADPVSVTLSPGASALACWPA
jgi:mannose-6-phosphate isomerase